MALVSVNNVSKVFGFTRAVNKVSFEIERASSNLVLGPNGSGKSTLMACIAGLFSSDEGEIVWCDTILKHRKSAVGFLGRDSFLYSNLTVEENLLLVASLFKLSNPKQRVAELIEQFHLSNSRTLIPSACSKGNLKRAALARVVVSNPEVLVLDEPFSDLDSSGHKALYDFLDSHLKKSNTLILSTHLSEVEKRYGERKLRLLKGSLVDDTPDVRSEYTSEG